MKFQKVYAEACEKKRAKEDLKREAELKLERAKKKEEKQAEKLRRYQFIDYDSRVWLVPMTYVYESCCGTITLIF